MNSYFPIKQRIGWIDVAKGNAIILMVLGHSSLPDTIQSWIFAFHMPLFFIVSGLTTSWSKDNFHAFFLKKSISLGRPFVIYSAVCILTINALNLSDLSWSKGWGDYALWFVPVLFLALLLSKLVLMTNSWLKWVFFILLPIISGVLRYNEIYLPWSVSVVPYASFFIIAGSFAKRYISKFEDGKWWWMIPTFAISLSISHFWHLDMSRNQCLPLIPLTIAAISGTIFMASISLVIDKRYCWLSKRLQLIGKETFIILAFSQILIMILNKYLVINGIFKYCLLIITIVIIKYIKDAIVNLYCTMSTNR